MNKVLLILLFSFTGFAQEESHIDKTLYVFFEPQSKYAASYDIAQDTLSAGFSVYYKEYVKKEKRTKILKKYNEKIIKQNKVAKENNGIHPIKADKKPVFSKWFMCTKPPIRVPFQELPFYITLEEYANTDTIDKDMIKIIFKIKDDSYLIWNGSYIRGK